MENRFWIVLMAGILACLVTSLGILVINKFSKWGKKNLIYFISFASGILITVSFLHIIPESFKLNVWSPIFLLIGFMSFYFINLFLNTFVCCKKNYSFGIIPTLGIGLHSFIDGIIYSVTFSVSVFTGILTAIGMILHEFPEGVLTFLFLVKSGFKKNKAILYSFLAVALSTPLGVVVSWPFIQRLNEPVLGILLALSAGALVYVGGTHLLPKVEVEKKKYSLLTLGIGILFAIIIIFVH